MYRLSNRHFGRHQWVSPVPVLLVLLWLSCAVNTARAEEPDLYFNADTGSAILDLDRTDTRYSLASLKYSSGFIPAPNGQTLEDAPDVFPQASSFGLAPDFKQHRRYWLSTRVLNETETSDWVVHISNFGYQQPEVLIRDWEGQVLYTTGQSGSNGRSDINTLGRAVSVSLEPGMAYQIIVKLEANHVAWHPYIALMSDDQYQTWTAQMDIAFKLAVGVILGMIMLGFICWLLIADKTFFWGSVSSLLMLCYYLEHSSFPGILWQSTYEKTALFWWLVTLSLLSLTAFAASFLQINRQSGRWYRVFVNTALFTVLVAVVGTQVSFNANIALYALNYAVVSLVILGSGLAKARSEGHYYWIYILGWLPMVVSIFQVVFTLVVPAAETRQVDVSYKMIHVLYILILHMLVHVVAMVLRIRALREERHRMEYISNAKSRFIAHSSHDLSQPLHSMNVFLECIKPHIRNREGVVLFDRLKETQRQMSESFKAIMDLTKLESGVIKPELERVSLHTLFARLENEYHILALAKRLELCFESQSLSVISDPVLLERMLRNLISNAIKYTDNGRVQVSCQSQGKTVVIQVTDTGRGIARDDQESIFDIYHRSGTVAKHTSGSGIGLSIVRHIAQLLDHPVAVTSVPGEGSCFSVRVPQAEAAPQRRTETSLSPVNKPVVALLIGNLRLRDPLWDRLKKWNCTVLIYNSVEEMLHSRLPVDIMLCEYPDQEDLALLSGKTESLAPDFVAACVCDSPVSLPKDWIALPTPVLPSQLRALLNFAARSRQPQMAQPVTAL